MGDNMFKPVVYLEVRVLLSAVPGVFSVNSNRQGAKDILTVKAEFQKRNNAAKTIDSVEIQTAALRKGSSLIRALGGKSYDSIEVEKLTADIQIPPDDKEFNGFSIKIGEGGAIGIMFHHKSKIIPIEEYRIEENIGHLTRSGGKIHTDWTYAGCPSLRIKTAPVFELGEEAELFLQELYTVMAYLKLLTGGLGEASFRCNAYTSLAEYPNEPEYTVKLRNLNSFNFVRKAVNSEISRQENLLAAGTKLESESRLWIEETSTTKALHERTLPKKQFEKLNPTVFVDLSNSGGGTIEMELPSARRERFQKEYGLSRLRAQFLCSEKDRADYFETAVRDGAEPLLAARWMAGELMGLLNQRRTPIKQSKVTAENFAQIIKLMSQGKIHSGIAKDLLARVFKTGENPLDVVQQNQKWIQLSSAEELEPFIQKAMDENPQSVAALKNGQMAPLEHLTGAVMKASEGRAVPSIVKSLIKEKLKISVVYVLTMGGAITAKKLPDGTIAAGNPDSIKSILGDKEIQPVQITPVRAVLSEEMEPADFAKLISEIKCRMETGFADGIVVTHGTDTISYTASLLFWLFSSADVPVILSTSSNLPNEGDEAKDNLKFAIQMAREKKNGVYMAYKCRLYSPLNLKFISGKETEFANWNLDKKLFRLENTISNSFMSVQSPDSEVIAQLLNEAASKMAVIKIYPGLKAKRLNALINSDDDIKNIIVELYSSGTVNMRDSDYSLKDVLINGKKQGVHFYCTSQQECKVDFSKYQTSLEVWRGGAVPMDILTTESVVSLYFAASIIADDDSEVNQLIEECVEAL